MAETTDLGTKSVLVCDNGLFAEAAAVLARSFGRVEYFQPWVSAFPRAAPAHVGGGLPDVTRVLSFWDHVADADVVFFPDVYFADVAKVVRDKFGKPVWSHFGAEALELDRRGCRRLQRELGIASPRSRFFTGVDALAAHLERTPGPLWVKLSCFRGEGETFRHDTWHVTETYLNYFRQRTGALADSFEFVVEEEVQGCEVGYDGWTVAGQFPGAAFYGIEVKSRAYVGKFAPYTDHPAALRDVNSRMAPVLAREKSVGFCSFECRVGQDGVAYMIDPCLRAGSPPFEGTMEAYANMAEIVWEGAHGRVAVPVALGKYLAIAMIFSDFALTNWVPVSVPEENRRWLKLKNAAVQGGGLYHVPVDGDMQQIGAVVAVADDLGEACELVRERAGTVKGYKLDICTEALGGAREEIDRAKELGIDF